MGKKIRRKMFKNRRRRKSSASTSSTTASSAIHSALSSPSTTERQGSYWEHQVNQQSRQEHQLGVIASHDEGDADQEEGRHNIMPRVRDFVHSAENVHHAEGQPKNSEHPKMKRKHKKHHKKHRHGKEKATAQDPEKAAAQQSDAPKVGFADDIVRMESPEQLPSQSQSTQQAGPEQSPGRRAFNMRQLSSRNYRPTLPKMLSNTVFSTPPPPTEAVRRPLGEPRARSTGGSAARRRASSLPDLNRQPRGQPTTYPPATSVLSRTDPLPPFQHQRSMVMRKTRSEDQEVTEEEERPMSSLPSAPSSIHLMARNPIWEELGRSEGRRLVGGVDEQQTIGRLVKPILQFM